MASAQSQSANLDLFDAYFRRADLDRDGQISGNEAVAFFQGSGLRSPKTGPCADMGTCRPEADWFPWSGRVYTTVSEEKQQANQQTPRVPELEKHHVNQPSPEEVNSLNSSSNKQPKLIKRNSTIPEVENHREEKFSLSICF